MAVKLNHTIVHARDKRESAEFFAEVFDLVKPRPFGPFLDVEVANEVTLAVIETDEEIQVQHYAFLVSEAEFDQIFDRVKARGLDYWADPGHRRKGEINHNDGGRGVYFNDPAGHYLEIITRPYGGMTRAS
jgi:extradiol dioxygenase family protein